jgi:hypothetical protein
MHGINISKNQFHNRIDFSQELFRNVAVGGASTFARIGSMSAPYIVDILGQLYVRNKISIIEGIAKYRHLKN